MPIPTGKSTENKTIKVNLVDYGYTKKNVTTPTGKSRLPVAFYNGSMLRNGEIDRSIAAVCTPISTVFHLAHMNFTNERLNSKMVEIKTKPKNYT
jgi:hypothetical protein